MPLVSYLRNHWLLQGHEDSLVKYFGAWELFVLVLLVVVCCFLLFDSSWSQIPDLPASASPVPSPSIPFEVVCVDCVEGRSHLCLLTQGLTLGFNCPETHLSDQAGLKVMDHLLASAFQVAGHEPLLLATLYSLSCGFQSPQYHLLKRQVPLELHKKTTNLDPWRLPETEPPTKSKHGLDPSKLY